MDDQLATPSAVAAPKKQIIKAKKRPAAKLLPRGIQEVRWSNATTDDAIRFRVRIKRKDFKADELFESLEKAKEFLLNSKTKDGRLGLTEREARDQAMKLAFKELLERRPFKEYINTYIKRFVEEPVPKPGDKPRPELNAVKKRSIKTTKYRIEALRDVELTWKPPEERSRAGLLALHPANNSRAEKKKLGDFYLDEIDKSIANEFVVVRGATHARSTIKREVGDLGMIWHRIDTWDDKAMRKLPPGNPFRQIDDKLYPEAVEKRDRCITYEEEALIMDALFFAKNWQMSVIVGLALATGMRRGEVLMLTWGQIFDTYIRLGSASTKTKKRRFVSLNPTAQEFLDLAGSKRESDDPPEPGERLFTYTPDGFSASWRKVQKRSGVSNFKLHDSRRTHITRTLFAMASAQNASPTLLAAHLGMSSIKHLEAEYMDPALEQRRAMEGRLDTEAELRSDVGHADARMTQHYANLDPGVAEAQPNRAARGKK